MKKTKAFFLFPQIGRIGEIAHRLFRIRNLYPDSEYDLTFLLPHDADNGSANPALLKILCRGVGVRYFRDSAEADAIFRQVKSEEEGAVWIDPNPVSTFIAYLVRFHNQPRKYLATLSAEELEQGRRLRASIGIPANAPIITFHVREPGFLRDLEYHNYRNADIKNYFYALSYLVKKGYWIIRFGDKTMQPLKDLPPQVIDAPFHPEYEPFFEPYFIASSRFYFGVPSGPSTVAEAFGVPQLMTNYPYSCAANECEGDLFVYKKYYSHQLGRALTYEEILTGPILDFHRLYLYEESEITLIENTPAEIFAAAWEMEARLARTYPYLAEAEESHRRVKAIQERAHIIRQAKITPDYYPSYPFLASYLQKARISHEFIRLNPGFLGHGFPRIAWGFHPRIEGASEGMERFFRERMPG
ncbi:MAG: TIGR04372 family glycosyltransferase [Magnetococcales bacterium]|nr:TIGR04372 family glycosyltransferase [Magnetococcales bacterium]